ncbi:MAG: response regulator [Spirochaetales bacterium]
MNKTALVVDDNQNNLLLEKDLLEVAGFKVLEATTGESGIAMARRERPDLVIMDVRLPDMRGSVAAKILRQGPYPYEGTIIFVTASVLAEGRKELEDIVNTGFIGKPINTRTFAREVLQYCGGQLS